MRIARSLVLGMVLLVAACATGGGGEGGGSSDRYRLTNEDFAPYATLNAYESLARLRRFWIQGSGGKSPRVFVNGTEMGGPTTLEEYRSDMVTEAIFMRPAEAMTQYGPDYAGGVIKVTIR